MQVDQPFRAEHKSMFDGIFQFTDIAGPVIHHQGRDGALGQPRDLLALDSVKAVDKIIHQQRYILLALAQGGQ